MQRLGYDRYVAQGGDVGANVTDAMGRQPRLELFGIHINLLSGALAIVDQLPAESEEERAAHDALATFRTSGFGYFLEQSTRPQTIGYALLDSPVALAAWMLDHDTDSYEKIAGRLRRRRAHGRPDAGEHRRQHHAVLVDGHRSVGGPMVLGVRTISGRSAGGRRGASAGRGSGWLHHVPRRDLGSAPRSWAEAVYPGLAYFNEVDKGGHFAAWEEPQLFSEEVRAAFRSLR